MQVPLLLQFLIALFTGMVAATFVPPVRRAIPRAVEIGLWIGLVTVCVVGVTSITDPNARELSASAVWGADQIIGTMFGLMLGGVGTWISDHRFAITSWLVILAGADIFALIFLSSVRSSRAWQPRVRLREWMELPVPGAEPAPARRRVALTRAIATMNRRLAALAAIAGTAALARMVDGSIWVRDVMLPRQARRLAHAAAVGRVESRARLDSLRDATAHLNFAARSWYAAAGQPAVSQVATQTVRAARGLRPVALRAGEVIDIQALLSAQSIGWYGPLGASTLSPGDHDGAESERTDRLAS